MKARYPGKCPISGCPHDHEIVPGQEIVRLERPRRQTVVTHEGPWGYYYRDHKYAHVECLPEPEPEPEYEGPVCRHCGASMLVDGEVLLRCGEGCGYV